MAFGIQTRDAAGNVWFDSRTAGSGIVADVIEVASGESATRTYPSFAGHTCRAFVPAYLGPYAVTVDSALGYPRVTVAAGLARHVIVAME